MGVRVYYTSDTIDGFHPGLIGPGDDGQIHLPIRTKNTFIRNGKCGSAPLYHQTVMLDYRLSCKQNIKCQYEYESLGKFAQYATVCNGTWLKTVQWVYGGGSFFLYLYSHNGKKYTYEAYSSYGDDGKLRSIFSDNTLSPSQKVERCWNLQHYRTTVSEGWRNYYYSVDTEVTLVKGDTSLKYLDFWELATETGLVMPDHDLRLALSEASEDLAASLPQTPINIAESLLDLVSVRNISKAFGTSEKVSAMLADSWLKWRYVYTTTKLDVKSMREFINRGLSLYDNVHGKDFQCYGKATIGDLTCRCSTKLQTCDLKEQFRRASQSLHTYDLWDIVPWSFIVDWFIPIGSMLQDLEYQGDLLRLKHGTIWYTCKWYEDSKSENFMRFCTDDFVTTPCSIIRQKGPTNKTIAMRCIDTMALLIGR